VAADLEEAQVALTAIEIPLECGGMVTMPVDLRTLASSESGWLGARAVRLEDERARHDLPRRGNGDVSR